MADAIASTSSLAYPQAEGSRDGNRTLPERKTFIASLGGSAFFLGLTGATIYGLRKARAQALREAKEAALTGLEGATATPASLSALAPRTATASACSASGVPPRSPPLGATTSSAPTSVFDDASNSSLPGVLRRKTQAPQASSRIHVPPTSPAVAPASPSTGHSTPTASSSVDASSTKIDFTEMDSTLDFLGLSTPQTAKEQADAQRQQQQDDYRPKSFGDTPVGLSLKAFLLATLIVSGSAAFVVEVTRRTMGVESLDEFVLKMSSIVPSRSSGAKALGGISPSLRTTSDEVAASEPDTPSGKALPLSEAMDALGQAPNLESWFGTLKNQLDAERDEEVARRFHTLAAYQAQQAAGSGAKRPNDSISRSYDIHSPLEDFESPSDLSPSKLQQAVRTYTLSISPLLPMSAFGFGFVSGLTSAGKKASLVFMAENAHRLPDTVQGWYFYSKTKNYRILLRGVQGGLKQGAKLSVWTTGFCVAERVAEMSRGWMADFLDRVREAPASHASSSSSSSSASSSTSSGAKFRRAQAGAVQREREMQSTPPPVEVEPESMELAAAQAARSATKLLGHWTDGMVAGLVTASAAVSIYRLTKTPAVRVLQLGVLAGGLTGGLRDAQERLVHKEIGGIASHT